MSHPGDYTNAAPRSLPQLSCGHALSYVRLIRGPCGLQYVLSDIVFEHNFPHPVLLVVALMLLGWEMQSCILH